MTLLLLFTILPGPNCPADPPRICDTLPALASGTLDCVWVPPPPQPGHYEYTKYPGGMSYGAGGDRPYRAYAKLDITTMTESLDIVYAAFHYYQPHTASRCSTRLMLLEVDPEPTGAYELWNHYINGIADTMDNSRAGWYCAELLANGIQHLGMSIPRHWFAVGLVATPSGLGHADGVNGANPPFLEVGYARTCDIRAVRAELTDSPLGPADSIHCRARFLNGGRYASAPLLVRAEVGGRVVDSLQLAALGPGDTADAEFTLPPQPAGRALLRFWVADPLDANPGDDTAECRAWVFPDGALLAEDFEAGVLPPGWRSINNDNGSSAWVNLLRESHSDHHAAACGRELHGRNDDWLVTSPFTPDISHTDSLGFFACALGAYPELLEVWAMCGSEPTDTIGLVASYEFVLGYYVPFTACLDAWDGQAIRLGFRLRTWSGDGLALDDICVAANPVPGIASPPGRTPAPRLAAWPNPVRAGGRARVAWPQSKTADRLVLRDACGRAVIEQPVSPGASSALLELKGIAPGCYFIEARPGPGRLKLVVTR